jgi:hypothetical protein
MVLIEIKLVEIQMSNFGDFGGKSGRNRGVGRIGPR